MALSLSLFLCVCVCVCVCVLEGGGGGGGEGGHYSEFMATFVRLKINLISAPHFESSLLCKFVRTFYVAVEPEICPINVTATT